MTLAVAEIFAALLILPPVTLPVALASPVMYVPVLANVTTFDVPAMVTPMLPLVAAAMFDVPAVIGNPALVATTPVRAEPLPTM